MTQRISVANPLPQALAHYVTELTETLNRIGIGYDTMPTRGVEGRTGSLGKLLMLRDALANPFSARLRTQPTLVAWPSLGLIDARLWASTRTRNLLVLHDPIPIRKQVGFDPLSHKFAQRAGRHSPIIVSHSHDALVEARRILPKHSHIRLPHPILNSQAAASKPHPHRTVVVAGQYKPERNLNLLRELGPRLQEIGAVGKIYGRGWPEVPGWEVDSRFLDEREMDEVLARASVVLIPYSRYYQSGIALRALELGTMSLSPRNSFAEEVLGADAIVESADTAEAWLSAVDRVAEDAALPAQTFDSYRSTVDDQWRRCLINK